MPDASPWPEVDILLFCWQQCCLVPAYLFMRALDSSIAMQGPLPNRCRVQPPAGSLQEVAPPGAVQQLRQNLQQHRPPCG